MNAVSSQRSHTGRLTEALQTRSTVTLDGLTGFIVEDGFEDLHFQNAWWNLWNLGKSDPFSRPDWVLNHANIFEPGKRFLLACVTKGTELIAVLPLVQADTLFHGVPVRKLRAVANGHTFRVQLLADPRAAGPKVVAVVLASLERMGGWSLLDVPGVPCPGWGQHLENAALEQQMGVLASEDLGSTYIRLHGDAKADQGWLNALSRPMRSKLKRKRAAIEGELGPLSFHRVRTADRRQLDLVYQIEGSGWKQREGTAIISSPQTRQFYDAIATTFAKTDSLYLDVLSAGSTPVAGAVSVSYGDAILPLKWGYVEEYDKYSPGNLLVVELLKYAWQDGFARLDISPTSEYKKRWTQDVHPAKRYHVFRGWYGQLLRRYKSARPWARAAIDKLSVRHNLPQQEHGA